MTCFVTVGTTLFEELTNEVLSEESLTALKEIGIHKVVLQIGSASFSEEVRNRVFARAESGDKGSGEGAGLSIDYFRYKDSIHDDIANAKIVIGHAGAGTCLDVLRANKPFIVVVNERLMNNHQLELATALADDDHLLYCSVASLSSTLRDPHLFHLKPFHPPTQQVVARFIDKLFGLDKEH